MVRGERHGLVIANALDGLDEARRHRDTEREIEELAQLGLVAHDFDLREHDPGRSFTMSARRVERAGPSVLPHLASPDHPETAAVTEEAAHYDRLSQPCWALRDGRALVIDGSTQIVI